jgi:negative regulator of replication initiation
VVHGAVMRITINLEEELYALVKELAKHEGDSISGVVNRLVREASELAYLVREEQAPYTVDADQGWPVVRPTVRAPLTPDEVRRIEAEEDQRKAML